MRVLLPFILVAFLLNVPAHAATIIIVNNDGPGEGFNDPTVVTPVGGNTGTTLGQQRLIVFQHAADIWGSILPSAVTIRVRSNFDPLTPCDPSGGVLGSAGPLEVYRDFPGAEFPGTWYHVALANRIVGSDLNASQNDIAARFNSSVDNNNGCLSGTNWYYGLDGNEGSDVELLPVVLHELGHGLGFSELVNHTTGDWFSGFPDVYSQFLYDDTQGKTWTQMTAGQRAASAVNTGNLVWNGFAANFAAPSFLEGPPVVEITTPPAIAGTLTVIGQAAFGPPVDTNPITAEVVLVDDGSGVTSDACSALIGGAVNGKIALIDRGSCNFSDKVLNAENAGAVAAIIVNNVSPGVITMGGTDPGLTIPSVMIELNAGNAIKTQLGLAQTVTATLVQDSSTLSGTSAGSGLVKIYAPNPLEPGSSVSHWDISASPNLLMEPAINSDLSSSVDLTKYHFEDIGWFEPRVTDTPNMPVARNQLNGNVPNPFNPSTTIRFELAREEDVRLEIYDPAGRLVKRLVNDHRGAGPHSVKWNGRDEAGDTVASGVYFYRLQAGSFVQTQRMVLLK